MRKLWKTTIPLITVLMVTFILSSMPVQAGDVILINNSGADSRIFSIEGEPSMILNGFDLSPLGVQFPMELDAVGISLDTAIPNTNVEIVIYQDSNGGSPIDATMIYRETVGIDQRGNNRILLSNPPTITDPVVWVGFYLPVGFKFNADTSGSSLLSYWAWTTGGTFDVRDLATAEILGPGDGSAPVGINMNGIARITAELRTPQGIQHVSNAPIGQQIVAEQAQDTSIMRIYPFCGTLLYDPQDIDISGGSDFSMICKVEDEFYAPTGVIQLNGSVLDMQRAGHLYKIEPTIPEELRVESFPSKFPVPVTHCIRIIPEDIDRAVIAETRGIPERWYVLPTVRFNDLVCAEMTRGGFISYFLPRTGESPPNVNLAIGWSVVTPHPLRCGEKVTVKVPIINTGQEWFSTVSGNIKFIVEDVHVRTGIVTGAVEQQVATWRLGPGMQYVHEKILYIDTYVGELHRLQVRVDFDDLILETNEYDNTWFTDYILLMPEGKNVCATKPVQ